MSKATLFPPPHHQSDSGLPAKSMPENMHLAWVVVVEVVIMGYNVGGGLRVGGGDGCVGGVSMVVV